MKKHRSIHIDPVVNSRLRQLSRLRSEKIGDTLTFLLPAIEDAAATPDPGELRPEHGAKRIRLRASFPERSDEELAARVRSVVDALPQLQRRTINLEPAVRLRLRRLSRIRGESLSDTLKFLLPAIENASASSDRGVSSSEHATTPIRLPRGFPDLSDEQLAARLRLVSDRLPRLLRRTDGPPPLELVCGVTADGLAYARLPGGRVFYDHGRISPRDEALFEVVKDRLPADWGPVEYKMGVLVQQRYLKYLSHPGSFHFPAHAQVAVDAGCYIGCKAIAMADAMGPACRVIAIEIADDNFELLERNIAENGLSDRVKPVRAAISDVDGLGQHFLRHEVGMGHSLVATERGGPTGAVLETKSLATIFSELGLDAIDYLNIQLNGAEPQAIAGLGRWISRVGTFFVACPYTVGGASLRPSIVEPLKKAGCTILDDGKTRRVVAFGSKAAT